MAGKSSLTAAYRKEMTSSLCVHFKQILQSIKHVSRSHKAAQHDQVPVTAATGGKTTSICEDDIKRDETHDLRDEMERT